MTDDLYDHYLYVGYKKGFGDREFVIRIPPCYLRDFVTVSALRIKDPIQSLKGLPDMYATGLVEVVVLETNGIKATVEIPDDSTGDFREIDVPKKYLVPACETEELVRLSDILDDEDDDFQEIEI